MNTLLLAILIVSTPAQDRARCFNPNDKVQQKLCEQEAKIRRLQAKLAYTRKSLKKCRGR